MNPFDAAVTAWRDAATLRASRSRLKNYAYSRQWNDPVTTDDGMTLTEGDRVRLGGRTPQTNNLIRPLIKSVVGRFRYNLASEEPITDEVLKSVYDHNQIDELDCRALEEFLISGCVVQRVGWEHLTHGEGVSVENVNPGRFFVNRFLDPRGRDIRLVGMLHDIPLERVKMTFAPDDSELAKLIEMVYEQCASMQPGSVADIGKPGFEELFHRPSDRSLCRVIEVWSYDYDSGADGSFDPHWHCRYYAPDGTMLADTRSPYIHGSHPFVVKFYPLTDGEVHAFIEDVIDQQRHINQLITTIDAILVNSAKGVLLFPTDAIPEGMTIANAVSAWHHPGGVLPINPNATRLPVEMHSGGRSEGASQLLDIEMKLFQQISGVSTAMQGIAQNPSMSASLYDSQVYNAAISLLDIFETFNGFRRQRDRLVKMSL
ncbi:MAG: hypothetical protein K2G33_08960 [Duncaniella sp.]|nr:hypothetical protein [Duncaniella sp.]